MNDNQDDVDRLASARLIELAISGIGPGFYKEIAFKPHQWQQIIAALRRVPSDDPMSSGYIPLCAGHAETWFTGRDHLKDGMKATCVVCAFERPPSDEMVTDAMIEAGKNERMECFKTEGRETNPISVGEALTRIYRAMLSAAEGRKT